MGHLSYQFHTLRRPTNERGQIHFRGILGKAQVFLDRKLIGEKTTSINAPLTVTLPPGEGSRTLSVLVEGTANQPGGFSGAVTIDPIRK